MEIVKKLVNLNRTELKKFAFRLAEECQGKDQVIGLVGPLGAGKTTFVKDFASRYGIKNIKSPTFIIGSVYQTNKGQLHHYDFYRLTSSRQLRPLGIDEVINSKNRVVLIEWVEKFPKIAKLCDRIIKFEIIDEKHRNVTVK